VRRGGAAPPADLDCGAVWRGALIGLAILAGFAAGAAAPPVSVTAVGKIVLVRTGARASEDQDAGDIVVVNANGSGERILTTGPADDSGPSWSPDGRRIVFARYPCPPKNAICADTIFVMNADGSGLRRMTRYPGDTFPEWSPRGDRIAFARRVSSAGYYEEIFVMHADGSSARRLTRNRVDDDSPAWSPDGRRIAFTRRDSNNFMRNGIWVMNADGSGERRLTPPGGYSGPAWSPDGRTIAFTGVGGAPEGSLYLIRRDGSGLRRLTRGAQGSPSWSPDGRRLAYTRHPAIYVINADGTGRHRIVPPSGRGCLEWAENWEPAWSRAR
jgi:TolB protein